MNEILLDCADITDALQLHEKLCQTLEFPAWYGNNLDALMDCLTELEDIHLVLKHWDRDAGFSCRFESVFSDAQEENEGFTYTIL